MRDIEFINSRGGACGATIEMFTTASTRQQDRLGERRPQNP
jgi:hypothetical protein